MKIVVVVAYNAADLVRAQARTLRAWLAADDAARVVVLDNSGAHETMAAVAEELSAAPGRFIARVSEGNTGFAPTVNEAVRLAEEEWGPAEAVCLLNPDVTTDAATITGVFARLDDPVVGIAAPLLLDADGRPDRGSLRRNWNLRRLFSEVVGSPGLTRALGSAPRSIPIPPDVTTAGRRVSVDITSGAFMVVRRRLFGAGMDTRLPMYLEDQEICHRARRHGFAVQVDTSLIARHEGGVSRKSHTEKTRALREMELATAPALSWSDVTGRDARSARVVIGFAATLRTLVALAVLAASPRHRDWASSQARLGAWLVGWSTRPRALRPIEWTLS